jgi:hypothetical protein
MHNSIFTEECFLIYIATDEITLNTVTRMDGLEPGSTMLLGLWRNLPSGNETKLREQWQEFCGVTV